MVSTVHIANTDVEMELSGRICHSIEEDWSRHSLCLQLQFLPFLYAHATDLVAVTTPPPPKFLDRLRQSPWYKDELPGFILLQTNTPFPDAKCISWGPSKRVQAWAQAHQLNYSIPDDWEMIRLVNSKAFSFRYSRFPEAALLYDENDLFAWLHSFKGSKIIKTCFGLSGSGNRKIQDTVISQELLNFCSKEWQQKRPLIGEPWVNSVEDFSTQWMIQQNGKIDFIGSTRFETDSKGVYQATLAGPEEILFAQREMFLEQHKRFALNALQDMATMGFFGGVGVDALLYRCGQSEELLLYPIVEINARQTMSLVALRLQQQHCPRHSLRLAFNQEGKAVTSFLPSRLINAKGQSIDFKRHLNLSIQNGVVA